MPKPINLDQTNIVTSWIKAQLNDRLLTELLNDLNQDLKTNYTLSVLGHWRRKDRPIPRTVYFYMLNKSIAYIFNVTGVKSTSTQIRKVMKMLEP